MNASDLWNCFTESLKTANADEMKRVGSILRGMVKNGDWPMNCGRSEVYHHLKLAAEICGEKWDL